MSIDRIIADLKGSGLSPEDIDARPLENPERAAASIPAGVAGMVIPYRSIDGKPLPFYRVRTFDYLPKYKQPKNSGNHVYFPPGFKSSAEELGYVIITEGEKKSACANKFGYPCVGFGGVDSWRTRTLVLPEDVQLNHVHGKDQLSVKIPNGEETTELDGNLSVGMVELIDFIVHKNLHVVICYDTDNGIVKPDVQRAAATLGFELRFKGVQLNKIKQLVLPGQVGNKVGLDDYLMSHEPGAFKELLQKTFSSRTAFPRHPNIRDFVNKKLQKTKMTRKEAQQIALSILCELDTSGARLCSEADGTLYYFNNATKKLMLATLKTQSSDSMVNSEFGRYLYQEFGLSHSDGKVNSWLATQFTSEMPIDSVQPNKILVAKNDLIHYQINDGQYITITHDPLEPWRICDNGSHGIMFESSKMEPLDPKILLTALELQLAAPLVPLWPKVLKEVRLKKQDRLADLISMLFYMSPFLNRWKGTQLPVEMIIGEPGSGKSSLYELRLEILLGMSNLRGAPRDERDWHASIVSSGGLHVTDNVQMVDKVLRQRLSDEMCRIVTEPQPHIEMRKLYTEADLVRIPVQSVFAITAVQQPFHNADLIQRSIIIELDKGEDSVEYSSSWPKDKLREYGGRYTWLAHELAVIHKFLALAKKKWTSNYKAKHRLINLEQIFVLMAEVLGIKSDWVVDYLSLITTAAISENDWALAGLSEWADMVRKSNNPTQKFAASDIASWASTNEDYANCVQIANSRSLGRYLQSHKQMVAMVAGIKESTKTNNKQMFLATPMPKKPSDSSRP